jgi:hypothetical protein
MNFSFNFLIYYYLMKNVITGNLNIRMLFRIWFLRPVNVAFDLLIFILVL